MSLLIDFGRNNFINILKIILVCFTLSLLWLQGSEKKHKTEYESYIEKNVEELERAFDVRKLSDKKYNSLASEKEILPENISRRKDIELSENNGYYIDYKEKEVDRYKKYIKDEVPGEVNDNMQNLFYCTKSVGNSVFHNEIRGMKNSENVEAILTQVKLDMDESYDYEVKGDYIQERSDYAPYVGRQSTNSSEMLCYEDKSCDFVRYRISVANGSNFIRVIYIGLKEDKLYDEFIDYITNMKLPDPREVELVKGGSAQ